MRVEKYNIAKHRNFILNSYLKAVRKGMDARYATERQFYDFSEPYFDSLTRVAITLVAESDDGVFIGFIVGRPWRGIQPACLDYVYVKKPMRRFGVAKALLAALVEQTGGIKQYSQRPLQRWQDTYAANWQYNPYSGWSSVIAGKYENNREFESNDDEDTESTVDTQSASTKANRSVGNQLDTQPQRDSHTNEDRGTPVVVRRAGHTPVKRNLDGRQA